MKQVALVTGASRGIGYAIAYKLACSGYDLAVLYTQDSEQASKNFETLRNTGAQLLCFRGNLGESAGRAALVEATVAKFGRIDVLVNNAGVAPRQRADLLEMTEESFDNVVGINTKGTLFLTQLVAKQMISQPLENGRRGLILNISSCSAVTSSISRGEYCISKAGISMLTQLFAHRLAPEGILVNEIRPGIIETDMTGSVREKYDKMLADGVFPLARWGTPEDVAEAVAAFVNGSFPYSTGCCIDVDGGFHIRRL